MGKYPVYLQYIVWSDVSTVAVKRSFSKLIISCVSGRLRWMAIKAFPLNVLYISNFTTIDGGGVVGPITIATYD